MEDNNQSSEANTTGQDGGQGNQSHSAHHENNTGTGSNSQRPPYKQTDEKALISLITGILSIVLSMGLLTGIGLGIAAIITGVLSRREHAYPSPERSMATAGMVTGIVGLCISGLILVGTIIVIVVGFGMFMHGVVPGMWQGMGYQA